MNGIHGEVLMWALGTDSTKRPFLTLLLQEEEEEEEEEKEEENTSEEGGWADIGASEDIYLSDAWNPPRVEVSWSDWQAPQPPRPSLLSPGKKWK